MDGEARLAEIASLGSWKVSIDEASAIAIAAHGFGAAPLASWSEAMVSGTPPRKRSARTWLRIQSGPPLAERGLGVRLVRRAQNGDEELDRNLLFGSSDRQ